MKEAVAIIVVILAILLGVLITSSQIDSDNVNIASWVKSQDEVVKDIERRYYSVGPFWPDTKNIRHYRVETDKSTYWFQYSIFGRTIEEETEPGKYEAVDD